jgi:predicted TPR repeat methyltransferase
VSWGDAKQASEVARRIAVLESERIGVAAERRDEVVAFKLAAGEQKNAPGRAPAAYVEALFDTAAADYDEHLVKKLSYRGPRLIARAIERAIGKRDAELDVLDIGCGTGLLGVKLREMARRLDGVDCSARMLDAARAKNVYDELGAGELLDTLAARPQSYDLITAGDVLVYFGDLAPVFAGVASALRARGSFAFSVESIDEGSFALRSTSRYAHAREYVLTTAREHGFEIAVDEPAAIRTELGRPVASRIFVAALASRPR